ncbi:ankyrin-1-like [Hordeum vulgare subsp. vulgare]|uniref:Uncharacterized protein n=1 Tax=Hordeum vulgare subsp. vulgare TaxID=112509 RepID=A0A8I6Y181_HORVV|nr:ankyrin-1-like [Hordeum vulgare subsp. vulgare]
MVSSSSNVLVENRIALQAARDGDLCALKEMAERMDLRGAKDVEGANALHRAADKGCLECCKFLIEEVGLGVNSATTTGKTPLSYALYAGNARLMKYLIDHGANPKKADAQGLTMLHIAAGRGLCEPLELLLSQGIPVDIMLVVYVGTPLHVAASRGQHQAIKILLEHGADPNILMDDNVSPLMLACCEKSIKCMRLLIEAGADANSNSYRGPAPLTHAVEAGWTDIVKFLLDAGADPNIPAEGGDIPINLAAKCGRRDLVEILFSKTKQVPSLPYWTVDGIIRTMESPLIRCQDPVPGEGNITALKSHGRAAFANKDYHAALYFFGRVIEIDSSDATMFSNRSACWLRMRELESALSDAQHCRKLQPDWCKGWFREGTALTFMEDYQGAADAFREALKCEPESDEIKRAIGEAMESAARSGDKNP